jgi:biuret amidohydrolase
VVFASDATGTLDHLNLGAGAISAEDIQKATLVSLCFCIAEIASTEEVIMKLKNSKGIV